MSGAAPMLEIRDLTACYGPVTALESVSLTANTAQVTVVLGANGAGKTTLLRTISGLVRPERGSAVLDGHELTRLRPEQMAGLGLGHVPEGRG
ncbi:MAG: ATP-binding cassette domain-containing protein, partial [Nocardioidaceae bacterium]